MCKTIALDHDFTVLNTPILLIQSLSFCIISYTHKPICIYLFTTITMTFNILLKHCYLNAVTYIFSMFLPVFFKLLVFLLQLTGLQQDGNHEETSWLMDDTLRARAVTEYICVVMIVCF